MRRSVKWFKEPKYNPDLESFDNGLAVLRRGDAVVGYVATVVGRFGTPTQPRALQPWVWFVVVWSDGTSERSFEDYPPWTFVPEMTDGIFDWSMNPNDPHAGLYTSQWLPSDEAERLCRELGIRPEDF
jgi:hypothetical protein